VPGPVPGGSDCRIGHQEQFIDLDTVEAHRLAVRHHEHPHRRGGRGAIAVLVLDDLHWADKPSLLLLQYLARNLRNERVLIIGTYRDVDLDRQHPLADAVAWSVLPGCGAVVTFSGTTRDHAEGRTGVTVLEYDLPYFRGPEACLHLLSLVSPVDVDLAVAYPPLMPTAFWSELKRRGIRLLEVPEEEFAATQATNVLTVAPRRCIMLDGSPVTRRLLEMADCEVVTFPGAPLSFKAEGGPTCLTRPVLRDPE